MKNYLTPFIGTCLIILGIPFANRMQAQSTTLDTDPSLKLHFDFDEDFSDGRVLDVSGNGNDGLQFNPTNWITATNGVFGSSAARFTFVGVMTNDPPHIYNLGQYLAVTNLSGIAIMTNATISLWAQFYDTNNLNFLMLMDCGYSTTYASSPSLASNSWSFGRNFASYLSFYVYPAGGGYRTLVQWPSDVVRAGGYTPDLATTNIHLYTITLDCPGNRAIAYYDGQPYQTNTIDLPWLRIYGCSSIRWLCIGAMAHDGTPYWGDDRYPNSGYFEGRLDDVRIYNRTLSAAEVHTLYTGSVFARNVAIQALDSQTVQVSWPSQTNVHYQVEAETALPQNAWSGLGPVLTGTGETNSITDSSAAQPARFFRVQVLAR